MVLLENLLATDYGLLSLGVIVFVIGMGTWLARWFTKKMDEDASRDS